MNPTPTSQQINTPQKPSKSVLPLVLLILGCIESILPGVLLFRTIPQLLHTFHDIQISYNPILLWTPALIMFLLALLQIVFGVKFFNQQKHSLPINPQEKKLAIMLLVSGGIVTFFDGGFAMFALISPIYDMLSTVQ